jgi:hypothetical protein
MFEAKLGREFSGPALPEYKGSVHDGPGDDFVVCEHLDGSPASRFGDLIWDFTAYHPEGRGLRFYFAFWGDAVATPELIALSRAVRRIIFALIWHRPGAPLSLGTLSNYLSILCTTAGHAREIEVSLTELLHDSELLAEYAATGCSGWMCETLGSLLGLLASIDGEVLGFSVVSSKTIDAIKKHGKAYRAGIKQHAPMPTRIYSAYIAALRQELSAWLSVSEHALELLELCGTDPYMGRSHYQQCQVIPKRSGRESKPGTLRPTIPELCSPALAAHIIAAGRSLNIKSLSFLICETQLICKLIIQTFTGMRDDEVCSLPYHCIEATTALGKVHHVVSGRTTKFNHGLPKRAQWVTNREGQQAILAAQAIADVIYRVHNVVPEPGFERRLKHPLFPSPGHLNLAAGPMEPVDGRFLAPDLLFRRNSELPKRLFVPIAEEDLVELELIDPHRAWRAEEAFRVGARWSFKTHQLRRSLALYAQRSGLVSLPSLRRQLQHLTEEMSRYYAKGSAFASDFIGAQKGHFGLEWQAAQPESGALGYILNVLLSDDILIGGHAAWVEHRLKNSDGAVLIDRDATMRRFKNGEMAYRETLLGGCTNVEECDQVALKWLSVDCLRDGCKNLVCSLTKLERVIAAQEQLVAAIDPLSVEYRTELADLKVLRAARENAQKLAAGESR